jgi:hypothetical protein
MRHPSAAFGMEDKMYTNMRWHILFCFKRLVDCCIESDGREMKVEQFKDVQRAEIAFKD